MKKLSSGLILLVAVMALTATAPALAQPPGPPNKVTICHKPGTPAEKTLVVPDQALPGHIAHGDTLGACRNIAFSSARNGNLDIYVMSAADLDGDGNGDNLLRLTNIAGVDSHPSWSRGGSRIAFLSTRNGDIEIYAMDAADLDGDSNGDNLVRLTTSPGEDAVPDWSPVGNRIAFYSFRDGDAEIFLMDATDSDGDGNGDNLVRLTNNFALDGNPIGHGCLQMSIRLHDCMFGCL